MTTKNVAIAAERNVDPSATTLVIVRFFGASGVANARDPLISAPSAGRSGTRSKSVAIVMLSEAKHLRLYRHCRRGVTGDPSSLRSSGLTSDYPLSVLASSTLIVLFSRYN